MEFLINPADAKKKGLKDGDWAELFNQFSTCQGVVNVSDEVPSGVISALFGWQAPSDDNPFGMPQHYANNLVAGGAEAQQKSNGAFYKNARAGLRKLKRAPRTATNTPGLSEKDRVGHFSGLGAAGNPNSKAKNFVSRVIP
jgi:predicted molibdopterin-dependent oxidoreductase YjgC